MALAESFRGTSREKEAHIASVVATVALAKIKARAGDESALALADRAAAWLDSASPTRDIVWGWAVMYGDLGGVYRRMGAGGRAASCLSKSVQLWKEMKLPPGLEPERQKHIAAVTGELALTH